MVLNNNTECILLKFIGVTNGKHYYFDQYNNPGLVYHLSTIFDDVPGTQFILPISWMHEKLENLDDLGDWKLKNTDFSLPKEFRKTQSSLYCCAILLQIVTNIIPFFPFKHFFYKAQQIKISLDNFNIQSEPYDDEEEDEKKNHENKDEQLKKHQKTEKIILIVSIIGVILVIITLLLVFLVGYRK